MAMCVIFLLFIYQKLSYQYRNINPNKYGFELEKYNISHHCSSAG